jgi:hypothetical protein
MSQSDVDMKDEAVAEPVVTRKKSNHPSITKACVLIIDDAVTIGGKDMGMDSDISSKIIVSNANDADPWMGFILEFPLGADNEDRGFGTCFRFDHSVSGGIAPSDHHKIQVSISQSSYLLHLHLVLYTH